MNYSRNPELWATHFIKDESKNIFIVGSSWDTDTANGDVFILKLDSCYRKVKCVVYTDTVNKDQQMAIWNNLFSDSLFFMSSWGFNRFSNQYFLIDKVNLSPKIVYNTNGVSWLNKFNYSANSIYIPNAIRYHFKPPDTSGAASRAAMLKFDREGNKLIYNFYGYNDNISSEGYDIFRNSSGNLFLFSIFNGILKDTSNRTFSPMFYEIDTNGKFIRYKIYRDDSVNQAFNNVIQFNDSVYILATTYINNGVSSNSIEKIKFYKLNTTGDVLDSFYASNWGHKFFNKVGVGSINLIKTFDNKIMCVFQELDTFFSGPRITFIKFDENFKLDTTVYLNKVYDGGCVILNDSINISDAVLYYLDADSTFPFLSAQKPLDIINVPNNYTYTFYPNPIKTEATFQFENQHEGVFKIILIDERGRFIKELFFNDKLTLGPNEVKLNFIGVNSGVYYLSVFVDSKIIHNIKIIKE